MLTVITVGVLVIINILALWKFSRSLNDFDQFIDDLSIELNEIHILIRNGRKDERIIKLNSERLIKKSDKIYLKVK